MCSFCYYPSSRSLGEELGLKNEVKWVKQTAYNNNIIEARKNCIQILFPRWKGLSIVLNKVILKNDSCSLSSSIEFLKENNKNRNKKAKNLIFCVYVHQERKIEEESLERQKIVLSIITRFYLWNYQTKASASVLREWVFVKGLSETATITKWNSENILKTIFKNRALRTTIFFPLLFGRQKRVHTK